MAKKRQENAIIEGNLDPKHWVEKSDPLVLMRSVPFSLGELKILDTYISRINANDDTKRTVIFTKEEYEELMGLTCADPRFLEKNTEGLLGKIVTLKMPNKDFLKFVLFSKAYYHKDEYGKPVIELTCTEEARDLFFCIGKYHYFKYALENVIHLNRKSSYLLYLHIVSNRYRKEWEVDLNELRDNVLDCKGLKTYQEFKEFKKAVLAPAVKEINVKTDCHFEYEAIKRCRRVAKIKFIYLAENQLDGQLTLENEVTLPEQSPATDEDRLKQYGSEYLVTLAEGCKFEFDKEQMEQIERVLVRINIPRDGETDSMIWGRHFYLMEKYAALNAETAKKARNGDKPIKDRFRYFLSMLEKDTFQPVAYVGD